MGFPNVPCTLIYDFLFDCYLSKSIYKTLFELTLENSFETLRFELCHQSKGILCGQILVLFNLDHIGQGTLAVCPVSIEVSLVFNINFFVVNHIFSGQ